jgi:Putative amidase domain
MPKFDRAAAANYAWKYALHYNPSFPDLSQAAGIGVGDCTNFVSQAMLAGGWTMIPGLAHSDNCWWYSGKPTGSWFEHFFSGYASQTWVSAGWFGRFLAGSPRVSLCDESDLQVGDIVQARFIPTDAIDHTMLVTTKRYGDVGLAYHTNDFLDVSLQSRKVKFGKDYGFVYWKVADVFRDPLPIRRGWASS